MLLVNCSDIFFSYCFWLYSAMNGIKTKKSCVRQNLFPHRMLVPPVNWCTAKHSLTGHKIETSSRINTVLLCFFFFPNSAHPFKCLFCTVLFLWGHNPKQDFTLNYHTTLYMVWLCFDYHNHNVDCKYCCQSAENKSHWSIRCMLTRWLYPDDGVTPMNRTKARSRLQTEKACFAWCVRGMSHLQAAALTCVSTGLLWELCLCQNPPGALQGQPHLFCPVLNPLLHVFLFSFHSASPRLPDGFTQLLNLTQLFLNDAFLEYLPANFGR